MSDNGERIYLPEEYTGPTEFVHLHNHTVFSKLDGVATPEQYAEECRKRGYPAMSATEHGNLASVPDMYIAFKKFGVKYIPGCEIYYNDNHPEFVRARRNDKATASATYFYGSEDQLEHEKYLRWYRSRHLTVLAKNQTGFQNLVKLCTDVHRLGYHAQRGRSRAWFELLGKYREGLIVLSGCLNGPISYEMKRRHAKRVEYKPRKQSVIEKNKEKDRDVKRQYWRIREAGDMLPMSKRVDAARRIIEQFIDMFKEDYIIETQMPVIPDKEGVYEEGYLDWFPFTQSVELAREYGLLCALANDVHYLQQKDYFLQRVMMAIDQDVDFKSDDLFITNSQEQYMKTRAELWATFMNGPYSKQVSESDFEWMCNNTLEIASRCEHLKIDQSPKTPIWKGDADVMLKDQVYHALRERGLWDNQTKFEIDGKQVTYREQADIELDRFISKGFASYFLITADLVDYGKKQGYPFNPRGSAGGSLVCMLLGIHSLDPMKWGLSFDRFMSPSRGGYLLKIRMPEPVAV